MASTESALENPRIRTLIEQAEETGARCVNLSEFSEAVQELELDDEAVGEIPDELDRPAPALTDDRGHEAATTPGRGGEVAAHTTHALPLFLHEGRRPPPPH